MSKRELASELERRRRALGMSKAAVAARSGVSIATVNRILGGQERRPSLDNVHALARTLRVVVRLGEGLSVEELDDAFEVRRQQAERKARQLVGLLQGSMALESQAVGSEALDQMVKQTTCELLSGSKLKLWSD